MGWIGWIDGSPGVLRYRAPYGANNVNINVNVELDLLKVTHDINFFTICIIRNLFWCSHKRSDFQFSVNPKSLDLFTNRKCLDFQKFNNLFTLKDKSRIFEQIPSCPIRTKKWERNCKSRIGRCFWSLQIQANLKKMITMKMKMVSVIVSSDQIVRMTMKMTMGPPFRICLFSFWHFPWGGFKSFGCRHGKSKTHKLNFTCWIMYSASAEPFCWC